MGVESRDGGVYNRPGQASLEVTSSITTDPGTIIEQRHAVGSFILSLLINVCVLAAFAQVKEVVNLNICCYFSQCAHFIALKCVLFHLVN